MFLHELSNPQREAFLTLAARLMSADATLHDGELAIITVMREEVALPASWRPLTEPTEALLDTFDSEHARSIVIIELLRVARADRSIDSSELDFVRDAARQFGFGFSRIRALVRWLARYEALLEEGQQLLGS
jgi:uncharacterized tellurite resistance protein B-like protein